MEELIRRECGEGTAIGEKELLKEKDVFENDKES